MRKLKTYFILFLFFYVFVTFRQATSASVKESAQLALGNISVRVSEATRMEVLKRFSKKATIKVMRPLRKSSKPNSIDPKTIGKPEATP